MNAAAIHPFGKWQWWDLECPKECEPLNVSTPDKSLELMRDRQPPPGINKSPQARAANAETASLAMTLADALYAAIEE
jgi:hypothetical protein